MRPHPASAQRQGNPFLVVGLAVATAGAIAFSLHRFASDQPVLVLALLGVLGFAGLLALFGLAAGIVHIGRLPRQRAFFDGLLDAVGDACAVTDQRGRVVYANSAYRRLSASSGRDRLLGIENLYVGFPDISERVYRIAQSAREGMSAEEEFRLAAGSAAPGARSGGPTWVRLSVTPVDASVGQRYTLWRHRDISADRQHQEDAFTNLQYIINYLDNAPAGFFSTTGEGRIAYVNATLAGWLGIDLADTTDGTVELATLVGAANARLLLSVEPAPGQTRTEQFDVDLVGAGGRSLPARIVHRVDYAIDGLAQPSRSLVLDRRLGVDPKASPDGAAEIRLARLVNSAPVGIAQVDVQGSIVNMNSAFAEFARAARRGGPLTKLMAQGRREAVAAALAKASAGEPVTDPVDVSFEGDSSRTGKMYFSRAEPADVANAGVTVFAVDTTKNSALEVQLVQSQKMQAVGQLAGGVAHDFNNVLTAIIGFSDLLLAKHRPTDPSFADIMNIKQNANRAANLVRQLLAFSRRQTLRPEVMPLTDVISDLGNLLGRLLGEKVELKVVHGRDVGLVKIDINQFEQVIINLAVNARDAMPGGGTLTVRTGNVSEEESRAQRYDPMPAGQYVLCEVQDTGTGMPPEVLEKIYEPFFSTKEVGKGTGLGLSTVYGIVKQTGGFIFCESEVGKGTTFRIFLPRHFEERRKDAAPAEAREAKRTDLTGKGTILLVEDEDAVRAFAKRALESRGYSVIEAESGEVALRLLEERGGKLDLVLSDVVMPEMDGPTLLRELRKRGYTTKVVFISGYAEDAFEKNLEGQNDFAFLPKPFTLKQLAEAVKDAIAA